MSKKWYAVQNGNDYDCGYGSTNKRTARKMATELHRNCPGEEIRIVTCRVDDDFCEAEEIIYEGEK